MQEEPREDKIKIHLVEKTVGDDEQWRAELESAKKVFLAFRKKSYLFCE